MKTRVYNVDENEIDNSSYAFNECADIIKAGGLVAFPTETVYGLGGNALDEDVSKKIYAAKGRPSDNPLIVHIHDLSQLKDVADEISYNAVKLAERFWPGPLTMILKKKKVVPDATTGGLDTVAVRMPSNKVALELIKSSGVPIAAPSANSSGRPSPTCAEHVLQDLDGKIDAVMNGGPVDIGLESTIVDVSAEVPILLRPGYVTMSMLTEVLGRVDRDPTLDKGVVKGVKPKAPGMMYRHYAPEGDMVIVSGKTDAVIRTINEMVEQLEPETTAVITTEENKELYKGCRVVCMGSRDNEETVAKQLYSVLRKMDEDKIEHIYVESFDNKGLGDAIMNRLVKAAGYKIIKV